jgi:hypothetical protein
MFEFGSGVGAPGGQSRGTARSQAVPNDELLSSRIDDDAADDVQQSATVPPLTAPRKRSSNAAVGSSTHRAIPLPIQLSDLEDEMPSCKKKKRNLTLGDAIVELSTARAKGDALKYGLLEKQLAQEEMRLAYQKGQEEMRLAYQKEQEEMRLAHQGEQEDKKLAQEEKRLELDRRRIEVEEKKAEAEILKYKYLLAQVRGGPPGGEDVHTLHIN